jgi:protein-L-isoaspartate(D-aspartate) O-methyltransferase
MPEAIEGLASERAQMVEQQLMRRGIRDPRVLDAMREVPREAFVGAEDQGRAYADGALPLGHAQTISQPYMVARAAELAELEPGDIALDVGLGSGYQAAVLSHLCERVIGIELVPELAAEAERRLAKLGYDNIEVLTGDGSLGVAARAPFDAILVAAATSQAPSALKEQLRQGGRLVIPLGASKLQTLTVITRTPAGFTSDEYDSCVYVPLLGAARREP